MAVGLIMAGTTLLLVGFVIFALHRNEQNFRSEI
jgi:hypothetical protein